MRKRRRAQRCKSKSKRTGKQCRAFAVAGYAVCRMHGAGSPKKGKPGGRPPGHGLYSAKLARDLAGAINALSQDPALLDGLMDIARIRALTERAQELLVQEEHRFLGMAGDAANAGTPGADAELSKARSNLLAWYERLSALAAATIAATERYYGAIERREGGVALAAVDAGLMVMVRVLHEHVPDPGQRDKMLAALREGFSKIVVPSGES